MEPRSLVEPLDTLVAPLGARRVCLAQLDEAERAADRVDAGPGDDGEALHDFRVALRRLRSLLRAFRPVLDDTVRGRSRRRLREVARATNTARDLEVQLLRLRNGGEEALASRWSVRVDEARAEAVTTLRPRFRKLAARLRAELGTTVVRFDPGGHEVVPASFATMGAALVAQAAQAFAEALGEVEGIEDVAGQHEARIEGKRLRYLIEPWRAEVPAARELLGRCKHVQEVLGELHDVAVWLEVLSVDAAPLTVEVRARLRFVTLEERARLFGEVIRWRDGGGLAALRKAVDAFVSLLTARRD